MRKVKRVISRTDNADRKVAVLKSRLNKLTVAEVGPQAQPGRDRSRLAMDAGRASSSPARTSTKRRVDVVHHHPFVIHKGLDALVAMDVTVVATVGSSAMVVTGRQHLTHSVRFKVNALMWDSWT